MHAVYYQARRPGVRGTETKRGGQLTSLTSSTFFFFLGGLGEWICDGNLSRLLFCFDFDSEISTIRCLIRRFFSKYEDSIFSSPEKEKKGRQEEQQHLAIAKEKSKEAAQVVILKEIHINVKNTLCSSCLELPKHSCLAISNVLLHNASITASQGSLM